MYCCSVVQVVTSKIMLNTHILPVHGIESSKRLAPNVWQPCAPVPNSQSFVGGRLHTAVRCASLSPKPAQMAESPTIKHNALMCARARCLLPPLAPGPRWCKSLLRHRHSPSPLSELESTAGEKASSSKMPIPQVSASRRLIASSLPPQRHQRPQQGEPRHP